MPCAQNPSHKKLRLLEFFDHDKNLNRQKKGYKELSTDLALFQVDTWSQQNDLLQIPPKTAGKPFKCTLCSATFGKSYGLNRHMVTHTSEKPYECVECGQRFNQKGNLYTHRRRAHNVQEIDYL